MSLVQEKHMTLSKWHGLSEGQCIQVKNTYPYNSNVSVAHRPVEQDGYALDPLVIGASIVARTSSINNTELSFITVALLTSSLTIENLFWYLSVK